MNVLGEEVKRLHPDDHPTSKTPRWWVVAPITPAEAPEAKRRTAARSRSAVILLLLGVATLLAFALSLFSRVGRQMREAGPVVAAPAPPVQMGNGLSQAPIPVRPREVQGGPSTNDAGPTAGATVAPSGLRPRPTSEVFRKPGF